MHLRMITIAALAFASLTGCSQKPAAPLAPLTGASLSVAPASGEIDVRLDAPVVLSFGVAVDPAVVERDFHLISEYDMTSAPCPDSAMGAHGAMTAVMGNSTMMRHLDGFHSTGGSFRWNDGLSECLFQPDSWMRPQTRYLVHLDAGMVQMMESRMGSMGGMTGHGAGTMSGDMMFHFTTLDSSGGGHDGHH